MKPSTNLIIQIFIFFLTCSLMGQNLVEFEIFKQVENDELFLSTTQQVMISYLRNKETTADIKIAQSVYAR